MCGLFYNLSESFCPNCGAGFHVEAGIFADDIIYVCGVCGTNIYVKMRWGKIASVRCRVEETVVESGDEARVGNIRYWKEHYGDKWLQAHDEWKRKNDEWWKVHKDD